MYPRRRSRLRVRLAPGVAKVIPGTGHGAVWGHALRALEASGQVKFVTRGRPDVWLASGHSAPPPGASPLVVHVHEIGWRDPELRAFLDPEFVRSIEAETDAAVAAATAVISLSESSRRQVLDAYGLDEERVHTVYPGVDTELFKPGLGGGREMVAGNLGLAEDVPYVLFVGVLHPRKNYRAVREGVAGLARRGLPHVLAIVGNTWAFDARAADYVEEAEAPLKGLPGRIACFRGLPDLDLARLMSGADAFCLPSFHEGFGLPALEAMASGAPVIVSNRGALPEVVGEAGLVVEPTSEAVEAALLRALTDAGVAEGLRRAGPDRARGFSWARTGEGWLRILGLAAEAS